MLDFILYMIFDQRLSHVMHTLRYNKSTLSLRPRAAATKNKMRIAENAFIFLIGIKNYLKGPPILQIFSSSIMGEKVGIIIIS
jgi:hypothetical protein